MLDALRRGFSRSTRAKPSHAAVKSDRHENKPMTLVLTKGRVDAIPVGYHSVAGSNSRAAGKDPKRNRTAQDR
jgi:hypothetical protein